MGCKDVGIRKSGLSQEVRPFQVSLPFLSSSIIGDTPSPMCYFNFFLNTEPLYHTGKNLTSLELKGCP